MRLHVVGNCHLTYEFISKEIENSFGKIHQILGSLCKKKSFAFELVIFEKMQRMFKCFLYPLRTLKLENNSICFALSGTSIVILKWETNLRVPNKQFWFLKNKNIQTIIICSRKHTHTHTHSNKHIHEVFIFGRNYQYNGIVSLGFRFCCQKIAIWIAIIRLNWFKCLQSPWWSSKTKPNEIVPTHIIRV